MLLDKDRMQRRVKILTIPDARGLDRRQRVKHGPWPQGHARIAQSAGEVGDVLRQDAAAPTIGFQNRAHLNGFGLISGGEAPDAQAAQAA
jgi:hypothetical protein